MPRSSRLAEKWRDYWRIRRISNGPPPGGGRSGRTFLRWSQCCPNRLPRPPRLIVACMHGLRPSGQCPLISISGLFRKALSRYGISRTTQAGFWAIAEKVLLQIPAWPIPVKGWTGTLRARKGRRARSFFFRAAWIPRSISAKSTQKPARFSFHSLTSPLE